MISASSAIPALPGAQNSSGRLTERASARTMACSRPPPPTTRTFIGTAVGGSKRLRELLRRDRGQGLAAHRPARAELDGDLCHGLLVRRLDDGDEVVRAESRPLLLDRHPELFDLLVDLLNPSGVVLQRLHAFRGQVGEHHECRHLSPLLVSCTDSPFLSLSGARCNPAARPEMIRACPTT